ncbi:MAG: aldehyde dehydrogenase family protein [Actinomycetales bacterium]|nr:aldehyde dehydrogenase family protein [Candidatus Phosphoribacter baldrii]
MTDFDADLVSIQEARTLAVAAREAQRAFLSATQADVDRICAAMTRAIMDNAPQLARLAHEETGYGVVAHKQLKIEFAAQGVWDSIKDIPTVGVLRRDDERRIVEIGWPVGVVVGLTPSTNPNSTAIFKTLIAVKARNAIIIAPHPSAVECTCAAVQLMAQAGERAGMPPGLVSCMRHVSLAGSQELMRHYATSMILATGGTPMVRAAHSTGKPALGVGPGNVPAYVDRSADIPAAAAAIVNSKAFDCSVICATEQSVVADRPIAAQLRARMEANGAHWIAKEDHAKLAAILFNAGGAMNPRSVGQTPQALAAMAGISVPAHARILVADLDRVGRDEPLSGEKLTTALGFYVADGWRDGCERSLELLHYGGDGHSLVIHATDEDVVLQFGLEKPAFRILVNTWGTLGAIGATTGVMPSLTLGPGGVGGSVVSANVTVTHLLNVKRLAYPLRPIPPVALELAQGVRPVPGGVAATGGAASTGGPAAARYAAPPAPSAASGMPAGAVGTAPTAEQIERIVARVLADLGRS